jgi:hypothetical protein
MEHVNPTIPSTLLGNLCDQLEWLESAMPEGLSVMRWISNGMEFETIEHDYEHGVETVSHAAGYLHGVADALGMSVAKLVALASGQRSGMQGLVTRTVRPWTVRQ